jgi:hypothetical protein
MKLDDGEKEIFCIDCNAYLFSMSIHDPGPELINCPMQKDPMGKCTGNPKKRPEKPFNMEVRDR